MSIIAIREGIANIIRGGSESPSGVGLAIVNEVSAACAILFCLSFGFAFKGHPVLLQISFDLLENFLRPGFVAVGFQLEHCALGELE